jgi:deoxyribodipyrimidine photo-lyase
LYIVDPRWFEPNNYYHQPIGPHRWLFIQQSLADIEHQLQKYGHSLHIIEGKPEKIIADVVANNKIDIVACAKQFGFYEDKIWQKIQQSVNAHFQCDFNTTLYLPDQIDTTEHGLRSFSAFRKKVESSDLTPHLPVSHTKLAEVQPIHANDSACVNVQSLSRYHQNKTDITEHVDKTHTSVPTNEPIFTGGETAALLHVSQYFSTDSALSYKQTRNALDGWLQSTKFSPYLAAGNISARQLWQIIKSYEAKRQKNESTYWIGFELLWREYFQWSALQQQSQLFAFQGVAKNKPLTSFYSQRFMQWCQGVTPYPLVNACMHQLNSTGFMSNRGRQIVASCLVNELAVDWRYGAAYFQQQLVDYDVASNWGNWQYIAGVGKDQRGGRHFNLTKQTEMFDPNEEFINQWQGHQETTLTDSVDQADWPCFVDKSDNTADQSKDF